MDKNQKVSMCSTIQALHTYTLYAKYTKYGYKMNQFVYICQSVTMEIHCMRVYTKPCRKVRNSFSTLKEFHIAERVRKHLKFQSTTLQTLNQPHWNSKQWRRKSNKTKVFPQQTCLITLCTHVQAITKPLQRRFQIRRGEVEALLLQVIV